MSLESDRNGILADLKNVGPQKYFVPCKEGLQSVQVGIPPIKDGLLVIPESPTVFQVASLRVCGPVRNWKEAVDVIKDPFRTRGSVVQHEWSDMVIVMGHGVPREKNGIPRFKDGTDLCVFMKRWDSVCSYYGMPRINGVLRCDPIEKRSIWSSSSDFIVKQFETDYPSVIYPVGGNLVLRNATMDNDGLNLVVELCYGANLRGGEIE